jgi:beta-galactosidase
VIEHPSVIGDFTWTGWDYLGEAGIGRTEYGEERPMLGMSAFHGEFPALTAWCGDIDITGHRRPQSHHREIVFGLSTGPHLVVEPPEHHGKVLIHASPWAWPDVVPSWTWDGHEDAPINVHVYAAADEVELMLDGTSLGRTKANDDQPFAFPFDTTYRPGVLEAVAWRGAEEVGRTSLRTATGDVHIDAHADRTEIRTDGTDLAFVKLTLIDGAGTVFMRQDRPVTIEVDGPGALQGFSSANPVTDEPFTEPTHTTFGGRALAVIRPTGDGTIMVTATADGCEPTTVTVVAQAGPESS